MSDTFCECCRVFTADCRVMAEFIQLRTSEGRQQAMADYGRHMRARAGQRESLATPDETWSRAQKAGAPMDALLTLKNGAKETDALVEARRYCSEPGRMALFLLLVGPPGTGKTVAATHCVVDFCRNWPWNTQPSGVNLDPVLYVDASTLTRLSAFDANDKRYVEQLQETKLLVLEDAGDEGTELGKGLFVELLMTRHARRRRTVICSNLTPEAFKARYGEAVADRIRSVGIVPNLSKSKSMRIRRAG